MRGRKANGWPRDSIAADGCPCDGFRRVTKAGTVRFDKTTLGAEGMEDLAGDLVYVERHANWTPYAADEYFAWQAPIRPAFWTGTYKVPADYQLTPIK